MRKGPVIHGAILIVALALGYQTWTRDKPTAPRRGKIPVWGGAAAQIKTVALEGERRSVRLERRAEGGDAYLWGAVTRTTPAPKKAPAPDAALDPGMSITPEPTPAETKTTREFPVGEEGQKLLEKLAPLLAVNDLGVVETAKRAEFKLEGARDRLIVETNAARHELVIGDRVVGGDDRYMMDAATGRVWVVPGDVVAPLEGADAQLKERKLHAFEPSAVGRVAVKTASAEKVIVRKEGGPAPAAATPGAPPRPAVLWANAATPDTADQTLANFMDRVEKLTPLEYVTEKRDADLVPVVRIEYRSASDGALGYLQLLKEQAGADGAQAEYYVRSERTRVLAKVYRPNAERVDQDLAQLVQ